MGLRRSSFVNSGGCQSHAPRVAGILRRIQRGSLRWASPICPYRFMRGPRGASHSSGTYPSSPWPPSPGKSAYAARKVSTSWHPRAPDRLSSGGGHERLRSRGAGLPDRACRLNCWGRSPAWRGGRQGRRESSVPARCRGCGGRPAVPTRMSPSMALLRWCPYTGRIAYENGTSRNLSCPRTFATNILLSATLVSSVTIRGLRLTIVFCIN
jgi:hypothetical protein